eukprot:511400_1
MSLYVFNNDIVSHSFGIFLIITNFMFCYWMWLSLKARNASKLLTFYLMVSPIIAEFNHIGDYLFFLTNYDFFRKMMLACESSAPNPYLIFHWEIIHSNNNFNNFHYGLYLHHTYL